MTPVTGAAIRKFAIVGAGPAGFYTAEALAAACPDCEIDMIERLPTPFGLVRFGVAPDHQSTKAIQAVFERIARHDRVRFVGNVEVDRDVSFRELESLYDAVILTSGVPDDAPLGIEGAELPGVYGAAAFVGWYNAHPDYARLDPDLGQTGAVIIGNGNVALDCARILSRPTSDLARSDIAAHTLGKLRESRITDVTLAGRRGALDAKFTTAELQELGELGGVVALADPAQIPAQISAEVAASLPPRERRIAAKNLECLQAFARASPTAAPRRIHFEFNARPVAVLGSGHVEAMRFERTLVSDGKLAGTGEFFDIPTGLVISAIGYRARPVGGFALAPSGDRLENADGLIEPGIYVAGWLRRGPSGKIDSNRTDAESIAARISVEVRAAGKAGFDGVAPLLRRRAVQWTSFDDWKRIESAEIAAALAGAPRMKFASVEDMLSLCAVEAVAGKA